SEAVEEDVHLLLDRFREEHVRIGAPKDRLGAARAELAQPLETTLRVRDDEVVFARVTAEVVAEARVHPAELGQAHRYVAVIEDDRDAEALPKEGRDSPQVVERHR